MISQLEQIHVNRKVTPIFLANHKAFYSGKYRRIINQGSTRSGKTFSICQLLIEICTKEKKTVSIVSPSLPHLKRGAKRDFITILNDWELYNEDFHNRTDHIITFPSGAICEFFGADDFGKVHGSSRDILFINEANLLPQPIYTQLALRTNQTIFLDYNPIDDHNYVYDLIDKPDTKFIHSTYLNNLSNLSRWQVEEIEALKEADLNLWKVYGMGLRGATSETIYSHWKLIDHFPECSIVCYGLDFGYNVPSAFIKVGIHEGKVYAEEIFYESKLTTNDLTDAIKIYGITRSSEIFCDAAEPKSIEEIRRMGLNAKPADKSVYDGILKIKSMPLYITRNSANLIKEIKGYKWKVDSDGQAMDQPVKYMDHALDALRYALYTRSTKRPKKLVYSY